MSIKRIPLCLNTEDPDQLELIEFITTLPNGKKRNASAFLKLLVDREYQKKKEEYLADKKKQEQEKKTPESASSVVGVIKTTNGGIKYEINRKY